MARPDFLPMIAAAEKAARALRADMVRTAHERGFTELQPAHNAVFATLPPEGARTADMAVRYGITRQSMGELVRDMAELGMVEMAPDPSDGRAKIVRFTEYGRKVAQSGYDHLIELDARFRDAFGADVDATFRVLTGIIDLLGPGLESEPVPGRHNLPSA